MWAYTGKNIFSSSSSKNFPGVISHMGSTMGRARGFSVAGGVNGSPSPTWRRRRDGLGAMCLRAAGCGALRASAKSAGGSPPRFHPNVPALVRFIRSFPTYPDIS